MQGYTFSSGTVPHLEKGCYNGYWQEEACCSGPCQEEGCSCGSSEEGCPCSEEGRSRSEEARCSGAEEGHPEEVKVVKPRLGSPRRGFTIRGGSVESLRHA